MGTNSHVKDPTNSYTKENIDKQQNSINKTNENRKNNIRPSICATEYYLQNHIMVWKTILIQMGCIIRNQKTTLEKENSGDWR